MDEFYGFLITGLIIIAALLFFLVGDVSTMFGQNYYSKTKYYKYGSADNYRIGTTTTTLQVGQVLKSEYVVGPLNTESWRSIPLGYVNATYESNEVKYYMEGKYLFNGLMFGSNSLEMAADVDKTNFIGAYIKFDVTSTNKYGALAVKFNGVVISDSVLDMGSYKFTINNSIIKSANKIELVPASSNWRIWAPAVYDVRNLQFVYQTHSTVSSDIKFMVFPDEAKTLTSSRSRLLLDFAEHRGILRILLNGNQIYNNQSSGYQTVYFDQKNLLSGDNTMQFLTESNGVFQGNAYLTIYYMTTKDNEISHEFIINSSRFSTLNSQKGTISFNISNVLKPGGMVITIIQGSETRNIAYDSVQKKSYTYAFNQSQSFVGTNILKIRSVDGSVFYVKDLEVNV